MWSTRRAPTAIIIPADVQELEYSAPTHAFKMVLSSMGVAWPEMVPDSDGVRRAAEILNAGGKVAMLVGSGARGAAAEIEQVADLQSRRRQRPRGAQASACPGRGRAHR